MATSPSYGEVLALKYNYQLDEDDVNALGIMLPSLAKRDEHGTQVDRGRLEARALHLYIAKWRNENSRNKNAIS